jgi:hypothetical protein
LYSGKAKRAAVVKWLPVLVKYEWYEAKLPPTAFAEIIAAVTVFPTWSYPYRMRAGRKFPSSRNPYVGAAIPAVIASNPHIPGTRPH